MWNDLRRALALFPTVVLTWADDGGYPMSVRLAVEAVDGQQVVRFPTPAGLELRAGPASLMGHSHDEQTWHLKSFMTRGLLEQGDQGWVFCPVIFIPGAGSGGLANQVRQVFGPRLTAKRYLDKRGLARPIIPWDKIKSTY